MVSEKLKGAEKSNFDEDFLALEKVCFRGICLTNLVQRTDAFINLFTDLEKYTKQLIQPPSNFLLNKITRKSSEVVYPEGELGESLVEHSNHLGSDTDIGMCSAGSLHFSRSKTSIEVDL